MEPIYLKIGKKIKELRSTQGMTQQVLAEKCGISIPFLSFLENGKKKGSIDTYAQVSKCLSIPMNLLFKEGEGSKTYATPAALKMLNGLSAQEKRKVFKYVKTLRKPKSKKSR